MAQKINFFNITEQPPQEPAVDPEMVATITRNVPVHVRVAGKQVMFSVLANYMRHVWFMAKDGTLREPVGFYCYVKSSGTGKGYVDTMCEMLLKERIDISNSNLKELSNIAKKNRTKGDNKDKLARPDGKDCVVLVPPEDISAAGLRLLLDDAAEAGDEPVALLMPEIDCLNSVLGGHQKSSAFIRKAYDRKRVGAYRATDNGITANPVGRVNITTSGTENSVRKFFGKQEDIENGSLGRFCITYLPHDDKSGRVIQGPYDEQWYKEVNVYIDRLKDANGVIELPEELMELIWRLDDELNKMSDLANHKTFNGWWHRSLDMAFIRACILYVGQGYFGKVEAEWVEWSLWHDLYSKALLFLPLAQKQSFSVDYAAVKRCGPRNLLEYLPATFTKADVIKVRESNNMDLAPTSVANMLYNWKKRHCIKAVAGKADTYCKTKGYLNKNPQQDLETNGEQEDKRRPGA